MRQWWLGLGVAALLAVGGAALLPLKDWSAELEQAIQNMDLVRGLLVYCAISIAAILLLVPAWIFPLIAGAAFGFAWGLAAALAASLTAALIAFAAARSVLRKPLERAARRSRVFKALDRAVAREAWKIVALVRMSPGPPSGMRSYFLGLTRVRPVEYALASCAGMLPGLALKVYVGSAGRWALAKGGAVNWALFLAGVAALIALAVIIGRMAKKALEL